MPRPLKMIFAHSERKINIFVGDSAVYNGTGKIYQGVIAIQQGYAVIFTFHVASYNKIRPPHVRRPQVKPDSKTKPDLFWC